MNVVKSVAARSIRNSKVTDAQQVDHAVNLYQEFPKEELSLDDFEENALIRLKVLHKLDQLQMRNVPNNRYAEHLDPLLVPLMRDPTVDVSSHYILRLAYCRTYEFRSWLLNNEVALLKFRLGGDLMGKAATRRAIVLSSVVPEARLLSAEEQEKMWPDLLAATPSMYSNSGLPPVPSTIKMFAVPFHMAIALVSTRQVLVRKGLAYVPHTKLADLVVAKFRTKLSQELTLLSSLPQVRSTATMGRMSGLIDNLASMSAARIDESEYSSSGVLNAANVKQHVGHMPLCMVQLQRGLERDQKLKHWGRMQYGLFLKSAGLSLEDALTYFERMFTATNNFQKEYAYNIRHMYGKEGKRATYSGYNCSKIINGNPPSGSVEHHGCPFKHSTVDHVTDMLRQLGIESQHRLSITSLQKSGQFQLACLEHFHAAHPKINSSSNNRVSMDNVGNHPNAWFRSSVEYAQQNGTAPGGDEKTAGKADGAGTMDVDTASP